ncbi:hypothetical protein ES692_07830 [Psychroserpens burtonensis]|uniref:Uncharacterized protein n=1 Tax=Psychroserpens burtonensis TaxID=49278 RepID=A0A5C7BBT1_9FLAO|nr:hypothetical protein [Psychroserpens burtonensis]TXE17798.1 hypothetical protein ES692_07830 [Psychroserpens burtonensis]
MKSFLLFVAFLISTGLSAQDLSIFVPDVFNSYEEATINFNDGTTIRGYAKITFNSSIKFKVNDDSKPDVWTDLMLKGVIFHGALDDVGFMYVNVKNHSMMQLLEVIELGEISIFADVSSNWVSIGGEFNNKPENLDMRTYNKKTSYTFFFKKESEKEAIKLFGIFNFKKEAIAYFENCTQIVDRLNERKYKRGDIIDMVYYYNDYCAALD